jgi:hypothetical protein
MNANAICPFGGDILLHQEDGEPSLRSDHGS